MVVLMPIMRKVSLSFSLSQNELKFSFFWVDGLLQNALPISTFLQIFLHFWNRKVIKKGTLLIYKNIIEIILTLSIFLWLVWKTFKQWGFKILITLSLESEICADWCVSLFIHNILKYCSHSSVSTFLRLKKLYSCKKYLLQNILFINFRSIFLLMFALQYISSFFLTKHFYILILVKSVYWIDNISYM